MSVLALVSAGKDETRMLLKQKREEYAKVAARAHALANPEDKDHVLSDNEKAEFDTCVSRAEDLKAEIRRMEKAEELAKDADRIGQANDDEERSRYDDRRRTTDDDPNRPLNSGERGRALRAFAMGSRALPEDMEVAQRAGIAGAGADLDMRLHRGYDEDGTELRAPKTVAEAEEQYRIRREQEKEQRAQGLSPNSAGGFLPPNAMMRAIDIAMLWFGGMRRVAEIITTDTGATLPMPTVNDTNQTGEWLAENTEIADQDVTFASVDLTAHVSSSKFVPVSYQLLQDSATNLPALLGRLLGERVARIQNTGFTSGTGTGQPRGILADVVASGVTTASNTVYAFPELIDLKYSVDAAYRQGAQYMMHDSTLQIVKKMQDSQGRPLYLPSLFVDGPEMFNGDEVVINNDMPTGAAATTVIYGQLSKYIIREVRSFQVIRLNELLARFLQVGFMGYARVDGRLLDAGTNPVKSLTSAT